MSCKECGGEKTHRLIESLDDREPKWFFADPSTGFRPCPMTMGGRFDKMAVEKHQHGSEPAREAPSISSSTCTETDRTPRSSAGFFAKLESFYFRTMLRCIAFTFGTRSRSAR